MDWRQMHGVSYKGMINAEHLSFAFYGLCERHGRNGTKLDENPIESIVFYFHTKERREITLWTISESQDSSKRKKKPFDINIFLEKRKSGLRKQLLSQSIAWLTTINHKCVDQCIGYVRTVCVCTFDKREGKRSRASWLVDRQMRWSRSHPEIGVQHVVPC